MEKISNIVQLKERISYLENTRHAEELALKAELKAARDFLKPARLLKHAVKDMFASQDWKGNIADSLLAMLAGFFSKKLVFGTTKNPLKRVLGNLLQSVVTNAAAGRVEDARTAVMDLVHEFLNKKKSPL